MREVLMVLVATSAPASLPTRSGYFARVEGALTAGDFASLPVPAPVAFLSPEELCDQCEGRGCLPEKGRKGQWKLCPSCTGMNGRHRGWDFDRYTRSAYGTPCFHRDVTTAQQTVRQYWGPCRDCPTDPVSPCHGAQNARVPWAVECTTCADTGWQMHRTAPAPDHEWGDDFL
ncbi:hypothetical protein [Nocardiopsis sp. LOL_012]|uniref:hypothetical protein n=1 Tax=Nocardiopsis sp. LOL_012 TaxID=3345409 RepID=UPI003A881E04